MKIALIQDQLLTQAGSERVFLYMVEEFPEADIYTLAYNSETTWPEFRKYQINTSLLNTIIKSHKHFKYLFPFSTYVMQSWNLHGYDLILSSSATVAKYISNFDGMHICYCYTPTRAIWNTGEYFRKSDLSAKIFQACLPYLKWRDIKAVKKVDTLIAISQITKDAIRDIYNRDSTVLSAPIEYAKFSRGLDEKKGSHYLIVSRLEKWKRLDYAIEAFNAIGLHLKIIGGGEDELELRSLANNNIEFLGNLDDDALVREYGRAKAVIFTPELEYGLIPLEANAAGTPVITLGKGGIRDTMIPSNEPNARNQCATAVFFYEQTPASLIEAVKKFEQFEFNRESLSAHAKKFSIPAFKSSLRNYVEDVIRMKSEA